MTDADLFRAKIEWETDTAVTGTFKRDLQRITDGQLMKAKALGVMYADVHKFEGAQLETLKEIIRTIEGIEP